MGHPERDHIAKELCDKAKGPSPGRILAYLTVGRQNARGGAGSQLPSQVSYESYSSFVENRTFLCVKKIAITLTRKGGVLG